MVPALLSRRVVAALRGAFVADAASMGTHWIYNPSEMVKTVSSIERPEFKDPPTPKYYSAEEFPGHYERVGMLSPYGEQLLFVTGYVAGTDDLTGEVMSKAMLEWATSFGGRPDVALKTFIDNMNGEKPWPNCGADDHEAHIYMKVVPVTCRYAGSPQLKQKLTDAIKVHQNNKKAVAFGIASARLLEAVLLGASLSQALATVESNIGEDLDSHQKDVAEAFQHAKEAAATDKTLSDILLVFSHELMKEKPDSPMYNMAARSCALPGSFVGPLTLLYRAANGNIDYPQAIRENILASGDTCSRAVLLGAILAAAGATEENSSGNIPPNWISIMDSNVMEKVDLWANSIAKQASS